MQKNNSRLTTVLVATIAVLLVLHDVRADDPACGPDAGCCDIANGTPGCAVEWCCKLVCGTFDPTCCNDEWDEVCAILATMFCLNLGDCVECPGDASGDGVVDVVDLVQVIEWWGTADTYADVNSDGTVDVQDLVAVIIAWGPCE